MSISIVTLKALEVVLRNYLEGAPLVGVDRYYVRDLIEVIKLEQELSRSKEEIDE